MESIKLWDSGVFGDHKEYKLVYLGMLIPYGLLDRVGLFITKTDLVKASKKFVQEVIDTLIEEGYAENDGDKVYLAYYNGTKLNFLYLDNKNDNVVIKSASDKFYSLLEPSLDEYKSICSDFRKDTFFLQVRRVIDLCLIRMKKGQAADFDVVKMIRAIDGITSGALGMDFISSTAREKAYVSSLRKIFNDDVMLSLSYLYFMQNRTKFATKGVYNMYSFKWIAPQVQGLVVKALNENKGARGDGKKYF